MSFSPSEESTRIKAIPLSRRYEDSLIWIHSPRGESTIRFCRTYGLELFAFMDTQHPDEELLKPVGKKIWGMEVPGKIKHFIWRLVREIVPMNDMLCQRGIEVDRRWFRWGDREENYFHIFVDCCWSSRLWDGVMGNVPISRIRKWSFLDDFTELFLELKGRSYRSLCVCFGGSRIIE